MSSAITIVKNGLVLNNSTGAQNSGGSAIAPHGTRTRASWYKRGQPNDLPLRVKLTQEQKGAGKPVVIYGSTGVQAG